jgi:hypothetical protein
MDMMRLDGVNVGAFAGISIDINAEKLEEVPRSEN